MKTYVSDEYYDKIMYLLKNMLCIDDKKRYTVVECLNYLDKHVFL